MSYKDKAAVPPYFDDYDKDKNFLRVLFNPGRAVQARELTQACSILQNQISTFGTNIYKEGASILGSKISVDTEKTYIELDNLLSDITSLNINSSFIGTKEAPVYLWTGTDLADINTATAKATIDIYDATTRVLHINYLFGEFADGDDIVIPNSINNATAKISTDGTGFGTLAHVSEGIVYVDDHFVVIKSQSILVEPKNEVNSHRIGYSISETVISSSQDLSLNDPANGSYNFNAPGADRYNIELDLKSYKNTEDPIALDPTNRFIAIVEIANGGVIKQQKLIEYSSILDTLAQRTFDESGSYSITPFNLAVVNHSTDDSKLSIIIEPGKAYVAGYEVETVAPNTIDIDRARTTVARSNARSNVFYGPYFEVDYSTVSNVNGTLDIGIKENVRLMTGTGGTGTQLNSDTDVRILSVRNVSGKLRIYLSGIDVYESVFGNVRSIISTSTSSYLNVNLVDDIAVLYSKNNKAIVFSTPNQFISSIVDGSTGYDVLRTGIITVSGGSAVISLGTGESFSGTPVVYITSTSGTFIPSSSYSVGVTTSDITITIADGTYNVTYVVGKQTTNQKTKTLTQTTVSLVADGDGVIILNHTDIFDLVSVIIDNTSTDVISSSILYNGQTDYFYDYGQISNLAAGTTYDITYQYFAHTGIADYFTVESYPVTSNLTNPNTGNIYGDFYGYIPGYTSTLEVDYNLRDAFDFRRDVTELAGGTDLVIPDGFIDSDYSYYVSRIDLIYADAYGGFGSVTGVPELYTDYPKELEDTMTIGTIELAPYTAFPNLINIELKDTRRYTMEDIGELERRLENVEYYSAMNLLEQSAKDLSIVDKNGFDKFKNGILVDKFTGHDVGDVHHIDYRCAVDPVEEVLRPSFFIDSIDLKTNIDGATQTNITVHDNIVTKSYTKVAFINQLLTSEWININPYNVFVWEGTVKLTPAIDNWVDTNRAPDLIVNQNDSNAAWAAARQEVRRFGTQWDWWRTNWVGVSRRSFTTVTNTSPRWWWWWTNTRTTTRTTITSTRKGQTRFGTRMVVRPQTTRRNLGDRVINTTIIPWIRARNVTYTCTRMKPKTDVIAFFDDVNVSAQCNNLTTDSNGAMTGIFTLPSNKFRTGERILRFTDNETLPTTSAEGIYVASGMRQTKRRTILSMTRPVLVRQSVSQSRVTLSRTTSSQVISRVVTTRWVDPIAESFLIDKEGGIFLTDIEIWFRSKPVEGAPVTLRIVENNNGYPSQVIVPYSEVTINRDDINIVDSDVVWNSTYISTTENDTGLYDVNGTPYNSTKFTFSDPVYLQDAVEYSFMLLSNSNEYEVFISRLGDNRLGSNIRIDKQPYTGVMFKSQNASTWTAEQELDIMFRMNRCQFTVGDTSVYSMDLDFNTLTDQTVVTTNMFNIDNIVPSECNLYFDYKYTSDVSPIVFENKENINLPVKQTLENDGGSSTEQLKVRSNMVTNVDNLSPVISLDSSSVVVISPELSQNTVISPNDGGSYNLAGTYITRSTNLANASDDIKVLIDLNKPSGTDVAVYFRTGAYEPRYIPTTSDTQLSFDEQKIYIYDDTDATTAVSLISTATVSQVVTNSRYYLKSISSVSAIDTPLSAGQTKFAVLIDDITTLAVWDTTVIYSVGEHVWGSNGLLYEALLVSGNGTTGIDPILVGNTWGVVPHTIVTELVVDAETEWREMVAETVESINDEDYIETTFKPKEAIIDEFSSFSIKIDLLTIDILRYPKCKSLRCIAVF